MTDIEMVPGPPCARCGEPMPSDLVPVADATAPRYHLSCHADAIRAAEPPPLPPPPAATERAVRKPRKRKGT